ncbi:hypothetical protein KJ652_04665 [Patescibacteria group bacterium]|nr:hypothetical protein [Patescibacteria group bacterium]MBU1123857.1 hypothetical protein [Patescibacteria group bacterium]MBU1911347.1 hypothetical protein [Patescibacteria group bacterium]
MRKLLLLTTLCLTLTGCGGNTVTFDVEFKTDDAAKRTILETKSEKVIERVTYNLEQSIPDISTKANGSGLRMVVKLQEEESINILAESLERPLDLFFALEADEDQEADIENEQFGRFVRTELTGEGIEWVTSGEGEDGKGQIVMELNEDGKAIWKNLIDENLGKKIGIFVRGGLVSLYYVDENEMKDSIVIDKIPSVELANVFADDVNVSIYVSFKAVR